ncbi:hypothetical protein SLS64_014286, partial [Diaporthe eres]
MAATAQKTLFLVGPGLIGGSLLVKLKEVRPDLKLHALTRRDDQAAELKQQGIEPVRGSLEDADTIKEWGLKARPKGSKRAIYIQTSGNDELAHSAKGLAAKSIEEKTLSDLNLTDEDIDARIAPDAYHRHVDGHLRKEILNPEKEKERNVVSSLMMPPLIYGIGSAPWHRISIQTPMLTSYMIKNGLSNGGKPRELKTKEEFIEFIGGKDKPVQRVLWVDWIVWGTENSYTSP